jgi:Secretion system C-terminal sorting domain
MRPIFTIMTIALSCKFGYTQGQPTLLWQAVEQVQNINIKGPSIALDKFGNTYMLTNQTDESVFGGFTLVKYDTLGNPVWKRNSQPSFAGIFYGSFTVDSTGNVYVSENYDGGLPGYDADAILVKYAPDGTKVWEYNYGLNQVGDNYIYYSDIDTTNGRLIALGINLHDTIPSEDFLFVQAIDTSDGSIAWKTRVDGVFRLQNLRIQADHIQVLSTQYKPDSRYFVNTLINLNGTLTEQYSKPYSGNYPIDYNYISKTGDIIIGNRAFGHTVTRVDIKGDTLWSYKYQNSENTELNYTKDILEDDSLNIYVTGNIEVLDNYTELSTSKFSADGNLLWQEIYHTVSGNFVDLGDCIHENKTFLFIAGKSQLIDGDIVCLIRVLSKKNGDELYNILLKNHNLTWSSDLLQQKKKIVHSGIGFESNINDLLSVTTSFYLPNIEVTSNLNISRFSVLIFPNPTKDHIHITNIDLDNFQEISIFDSKGRIVIKTEISSAESYIPISDIPAGVYIVTLTGKDISLSKKIIKI